MVNQTAGAHQETVQLAVGVQRLHTVIKATDYIVTARSLTTGKDDTHVDGFHLGSFAFLKCDNGHSVGVGEHSLDFILVSYTLSCGTFFGNHCTLQCFGQLGLIGSTGNLQCALFHKLSLKILNYKI